MQWVQFYLLLIIHQVVAVDENSRVDCYPEPGATQAACEARGCVWKEASQDSPIGIPWCFYSQELGYKVDMHGSDFMQLSPVNPTTAYGENISPLYLTVKPNGATLLLSIGTSDRYVPPIHLPKNPGKSADSLVFSDSVIGKANVFAFRVVRKSTGTKLWDTSIGGMQFADKFIQIATYLPSKNLFGFGQHVHKRLKHDLSRYIVWPMFARDIAPDSTSPLSTQNLYGVHPFYICVENDGLAHGVFIFNSNAQEIVTGPAPHLIYRTIGGQLDIAFFPGPTPEEVVQQYLAHIGTPFLPAYWALGYQLSRWNYKDLDELKKVIARTQAARVPLDIAVADIDYMDRYKDFTVGAGWSDFAAYVNELHNKDLYLVLIFDPAIQADYDSFQRGLDKNVSFIEWAKQSQVPMSIQKLYPMAANTMIMLGNVWPDRNTAFPDFLDPNNQTQDWWTLESQMFHDKIPFDGMWIDMNEPSNFDTDTYQNSYLRFDDAPKPHLSCPISGPDAELDNPPYKTYAVYNRPADELCTKTLCMLAKTARRTMNFFDTKNLYGAMEFNWFGLPYVGSDICGFSGNTTEELCLRWHQMGAFHSFCRDHNAYDGIPQDPAVWPSVATAARIALGFRYKYLPYLYSLHYAATAEGHTVVRPLFFEFPHDTVTMEVDHQFMWGSALMIAPAVDEGVTAVHAYFPDDVWYSLVTESYAARMDVGYIDVEARLDSLTPVYARGGYVIPRQASNMTTTQSRRNPLELLITMGSNITSQGELYWDAGDDLYDTLESHKRHHWSFKFEVNMENALLTGICDSCDATVSIPPLNIIEVFGYNYYP
ncbi:unnamed protein product, partial [Cylicocyclus nassatus]